MTKLELCNFNFNTFKQKACNNDVYNKTLDTFLLKGYIGNIFISKKKRLIDWD